MVGHGRAPVTGGAVTALVLTWPGDDVSTAFRIIGALLVSNKGWGRVKSPGADAITGFELLLTAGRENVDMTAATERPGCASE